MRIAYLEGFSGISGDMLLGAFVHAGVPPALLQDAVAGLGLGATLRLTTVNRSGISALKADVLVDGHPAEEAHHHEHAHGEHHDPHHGHAHAGHDHEQHPHHHAAARSLTAIRAILNGARLDPAVKATALRTFELLGAAEAKIHQVPVDTLHIHEVGAVDSIVDIALAAVAARSLGIERWYCSPLNVGGGTVQCAHGRYPVPAPATAELLKGVPTYSAGPLMELVTPTGAALVRALGCEFGPAPAMRVTAIGYGAGSKNPPGLPNVLRLSVGEADVAPAAAETVTVIETALDDLNPQVIAHVTERALGLGALDVMTTAVQMKKNRPGTLLTILTGRDRLAALEELLFRETSTLGLRVHEERRVTLERVHVEVSTPWGPVRVKTGRYRGAETSATPEFEDCRRLAEANNQPVKRVIEAALQAYRQQLA
jgi:uncharacterized protein (TIGR00299 family) protein